jgi:hypothetical protein
MQAKSFCQVHKVLLENLILFQKPVSYCFALFSWILEKIRNWFGLIWIHYANSRKEIRKTEIEKEPEQKKEKGSHWADPGTGAAQKPPNQPSLARFSPAAR